MSNTKTFDRALHDESDPPARAVVKEFYGRIWADLTDNPDPYGVDLIGEGIAVEVEQRKVWKAKQFPFEQVNFLVRKVKFFKAAPEAVDYCIVSDDFKRLGIIKGDAIMRIVALTEPKIAPNKYCYGEEQFYELPRDAFTWFEV